MTRTQLEQYQVFVYLAAIALGLGLGGGAPAVAAALDVLLWPSLALLLWATFTQVPLSQVRAGLTDVRFLLAALTGNFVLVPLVVAGLLLLLPDDPALRLGVALVLLVPCTDWFITFTHLSGGDGGRAVAFTPLSLLLQILLLPFYVSLLLGTDVSGSLLSREVVWAFVGVILLPLVLAAGLQHWVVRYRQGTRVLERCGWLPVPLLALVLAIVAASQSAMLASVALDLLAPAMIFVVYLVVALALAWWLAWLFRLPAVQGRVLAFSLGSRNSFMVLPVALALPVRFELVVTVIVLQSLIELLGMLVYVRWVPRAIFPLR